MITVTIDEDMALNLLTDRVEYWTSDSKVQDLFYQMYENYVDGGVFDGGEFDVMQIVDNDYVNNTSVIYEEQEEFAELLEIFREQGLGDCSCESNNYSYIEAVDDDENPTMFLVRW